MSVIDNLTLALLAKQSPKALVYAQQEGRPEGHYWRQHAQCCVTEQRLAPTLYRYTDQPPRDGQEAVNSRNGQCAVCALLHSGGS